MDSINHQKNWTAYHEAGHAVVAHHLKAKLGGIRLERENAPAGWSNWEGSTDIGRCGLDQDTRMRTALAGPLAEAKFRAIAEYGVPGNQIVQFDHHDPESPFVRAVREWGSEGNITTEFHFTICNDRRKVSMEIFEDDLHFLKPKQTSTDEHMLHSAVSEVRGLLDHPTTWQAVEALAQRILALKAICVERVEMDGQQVVEFINAELDKSVGNMEDAGPSLLLLCAGPPIRKSSRPPRR